VLQIAAHISSVSSVGIQAAEQMHNPSLQIEGEDCWKRTDSQSVRQESLLDQVLRKQESGSNSCTPLYA
jgi:hypothetical protein